MRKVYSLLLAILLLSTAGLKAQIAVTVSGNTNTTPNLAGSYTSLASALSDLNSVTAMTGPVTLTLAAGGSETAPPTGLTIGSATLNPVLSSTNTVTLAKASGTVTLNAGVGTATPASAAPDGILKLVGADWITVDGLTFTDANAASATVAMEYGLGLFKLSASDGAQNNTIKNCTFNMQSVNNTAGTAPMLDGSVGILVINSTPSAAITALTPSAASGTNSSNKFYSNTINGGNTGIGLSGYAATTGYPLPPLGDVSNDIGGTGAPAATTGNTVLNFGGAASASNAAVGIRANNQWGLNVSNNTVNNNNGSGVNHVNTLRGIYGQAGTSANVTISYNTVTVSGGGTTSALTAIENAIGSTASSNTVTITNNVIQNCTYTSATTATFTGILAAASATNQIVNNNQVVNNTIGLAGTASSCTFQGIYSSVSSTNFTANSNVVSNNTLNNSFGTIYCIRASTSTLVYDGNTISNNTIPNSAGATSSTIYGFYDGSSPVTETYTNNNINNLTINGSSTATAHTIYGIYNLTATGTKIFTSNNINNLTFFSSGTGYATVAGIRNAYATTSTISKNVIHTLSSTGTTPTVAGLYLGSSSITTINAFNNLIGNLSTPASTGHNLFGIYTGSVGTNINIYYNTVYLNATSTGSNFSSSAVFMSSTTPTVTLRNNIFVNLSTATGSGFTAALRRTSTTLTSYGSASNNNLFYAGTPSPNNVIYYDGTNADVNLYSFKARVTPRETSSVTENPSFLSTVGSSPNFLHINPAVPTQAESGAVNIATYTDDFDGQVRQGNAGYAGTGTAPDIGADEFEGTVAPAMVYTSSNAVQQTGAAYIGVSNQAILRIDVVTNGASSPLSVSQLTLNANGTTNITDLTNAKVYFTGGSSTFNTTTLFGSATPTIADFTVTGSQILSAGTNYFWLAYDVANTAAINNSIDGELVNITVGGTVYTPTTGAPAGNKVVVGPMSGVYNVGAAQVFPNFTTLTNAISDLNTRGVSGPVSFKLLDANYSVSETFPLVINAVTGASASNTVTISPATGVNATISGNVPTGAVIKLNGADYITIDGSNNGTSTRNLTIQNLTTTTSGNAVIWLSSPALGNGATYNTVKNSILEGDAAATTFLGMYVGGNATISLTAAGTETNSYNTITNNLFRKFQYGLAFFGYAAASPDLGNVISNNNFGTAIAGEGFLLEGIHTDRQSGLIVSGNDVQNVKGTSTTTMYGIRLLDFKDGQAYQNRVHNINYSGTSTGRIYGIAVVSSTYTTAANPSNALFYNNLVYDLTSSSTGTTWNMTGMFAGQGYGDKFYFNTVHLTGQLNNSSSGLVAAFANGDAGTTTAGTNIDVRDNIFNLAGSSLGGNVYAYYTTLTSTTGVTQDYNVLRAAGTGATNNTGRFNSVNYATLAAWRAATGLDVNSIESDPLLNGPTNLQPQIGSPVVAAGTSIAGITTDINNTTRNNPPYIGAYESVSDLAAPVITYTLLTNTCTVSNRTLTATIVDASGVPTSGTLQPRIYFKKSAGGTWFSTQGTLASGTATNGTWNFTIDATLIGGLAVNDVVYYYVIAQDILGNIGSNPAGVVASNVNTVTTHPTSPNTYSIGATLSGPYTIGASGANFPTIGAAVSAYSTACLTGPVTFNLIDANYGGESFPIVIPANSTTSVTNTVTFKPASGVTTTITGSVASDGLIKLSGADYVVIDGSNNGSSSRDLTINNTNTTAPTAVSFISLGTGSGATYNTIKNCNITVASSSSISYGVSIGGATPGTNGADNDYDSVSNNVFTGVNIGVFASGTASVSAGGLDNLVIKSNTITVNNTITTAFGIRVGNGLNSLVSQNTTSITTTASGQPVGISLETGFVSSSVSRNLITTVYTSATGGYGGRGITVGTGTTTSDLTLSNNIIYGVNGSSNYSSFSNSSALGIGIGIIGSSTVLSTVTGGVNVLHNSINMFGTFPGYASAATITTALYVGSAATALDVRNNVFVNSLNNQHATYGAASKSYAIYSAAANTAFTTINYNDYYVSGSQGVLGYLASDRTTLSAWQTASGQDANSLSVDPQFVSNTDLHLQATSPVKNTGTTIAAVPQDYDFENRDLSPDMGADEIMGTVPVTITGIKAYQQGTGVQVEWNVATQINVLSYEVERSVDGRSFSKVGTVQARGNTTSAIAYNWLDAAPVKGNNFYRIRIVNLSGAAQYTGVAKVFVGKGAEGIAIYPNPVIGDVVNLQLTSLGKGTYTARLINQLGQTVFTEVINHNGGSANQTLNISKSLANGVYQLQVVGEGKQFSQQLVK